MILPLLLRFSIKDGKNRGFGMWFPLFLLWPLFMLIALVILPFWVLAGFFMLWSREGRIIWSSPWLIYELFCSMRGMVVQVRESGQNIDIKFI